jgi:protein tyrosine phosphatase (PTP) superfamily phosphohydrolase (DUF442 family)
MIKSQEVRKTAASAGEPGQPAQAHCKTGHSSSEIQNFLHALVISP